MLGQCARCGRNVYANFIVEGENTHMLHCSYPCAEETLGRQEISEYLQDMMSYRSYREGLIDD